MAEAVVRLRVDATGATRALSNVQQQTNKLSVASNRATTSLTATSTAAKGLGASLAASLGPLLAVGTAFTAVSNSVGTFLARDRDIKILTQGLQNLGASAGDLKDLQTAADELGRTTLFNEEDFTRGFNLLTSFRNIGVDAYTRVAQAAADIAQVNQVDVSTSFMQLAKALQDPERNLSNLNRSGIAFTKQQTEVIKQLMKTNKVAEAHKMILDIVDESYNKLAQAAAGGFAGSVDTLGESFRDFSEVLGKALVPVIEPVIKGLTQLLTFLTTEGGQAVMILTALGGAAKALSLTLPALSAGMIAVAKAGGILTIALNAIPFVAVATGIGAVVTQLIKQRQEQDKVTEAIKKGEVAQLKALESNLSIKMAKEFAIINSSNDKKTINAAERRLALLRAEYVPIRKRLDTVIQENAELDKANKLEKERKDKIKESEEAAKKLKETMTAIGEEIESSIKNNLRDAITGAKSFGEAMVGVLNKIRDKIIDAQLDKLLGNFGENFGKSASSGGGKGLGGFLGGILGGLFGGLYADGGQPPVNKISVVGERGRELFVPRSAGTIIPNDQIGGSSITNNISISVDATSSNVQSDGDGQQFGEALAAAIQLEIVKQKRSGGLLA